MVMWHWNVAPGSALNANVGVVSVDVAGGAWVSVDVGAMVSMVNEYVAAAPVLPAASVARTLNA